MKKTLLTFSIALLTLMLLPQKLQAWQISVDEQGTINFYRSQILGDSDDREEKHDQDEDKNEDRKEEKDEDKDRERNRQQNEQRENESQSKKAPEKRVVSPPPPVKRDVIKSVPVWKNQTLELETHDDEVRMKMEDDNEERHDKDEVKDIDQEVELDFPSRLNPTQLRKFKTKLETEVGEDEAKLEYANQRLEERQLREEEKIEVRSGDTLEGEKRLEIKSRFTKAVLNGASFELDPETNAVTLTTPSGNEHTLIHLPDQAIERMQAVYFGEGDDNGQLVEAEVELEVEDGRTVYKAKSLRKKKLLGLFDRYVESEVTLDDETGEVNEQEPMDKSLLQTWLDNLSF